MSFFLIVSFVGLLSIIKLLFIVPSRLSHLPRAPLLPLLFSYLSLEPENERIRRIILPFANEKGEPIVLVWAFGMWVVHILDYEVGQIAMKDKIWVRQLPPQDLLFWKFVGRQNLVFTQADEWKKHSRVVASVFSRPPPIRDFVAVAQRLINAMDRDVNKTVPWDKLSKRVTIDILSTTVLGNDIRALDFPDSLIPSTYNRCVAGLTAPPYIFLPFLDRYFPRQDIVNDAAYLRTFFMDLIKEKATNPGNDLISLMVAEPSFSEQDVLDNVSLFFVAGHETTAGALSSIIYYFATNPECQDAARAEVSRVFVPKDGLDTNIITQMPFVFACIQEAMRMNNPSNFTLPRSNSAATTLGKYAIPPDTLMCFSMSGVHHDAKAWESHDTYIPKRFMDSSAGGTGFFGAGLRQCPARHFAMWELRTITIMLLNAYKWSLPPGSIHADKAMMVENCIAVGASGVSILTIAIGVTIIPDRVFIDTLKVPNSLLTAKTIVLPLWFTFHTAGSVCTSLIQDVEIQNIRSSHGISELTSLYNNFTVSGSCAPSCSFPFTRALAVGPLRWKTISFSSSRVDNPNSKRGIKVERKI